MIKKGLNQYPSWTQKIVWVKLTNTDSYLTVKKTDSCPQKGELATPTKSPRRQFPWLPEMPLECRAKKENEASFKPLMWAMTKGNKGGTCLIHTPQMLRIPCNSLQYNPYLNLKIVMTFIC